MEIDNEKDTRAYIFFLVFLQSFKNICNFSLLVRKNLSHQKKNVSAMYWVLTLSGCPSRAWTVLLHSFSSMCAAAPSILEMKGWLRKQRNLLQLELLRNWRARISQSSLPLTILNNRGKLMDRSPSSRDNRSALHAAAGEISLYTGLTTWPQTSISGMVFGDIQKWIPACSMRLSVSSEYKLYLPCLSCTLCF